MSELRSYTSAERKAMPVHSGVMLYFPDAICAIARLSKKGNDKHNRGEPLHWAREKSTDHEECVARHMLTPENVDPETGEAELVAVVWRALAALQVFEEKRLVAAGIMPLSGVVPKVATALEHKGPVGTRSGLGRLPCGCKAYEGATMLPQRDPGDECEGPVRISAGETEDNGPLPFRPRYSEQDDLSPDGRYGS